MYRTMGRIHAEVTHGLRRARTDERGQGTVEYVGLVMLMATLLAAVLGSGAGAGVLKEIPATIAGELKEAIAKAGGGK